ncbi:hypothetical protein AB0I60_34575 [Actinosynnema sp. NPDC050436]|uniref:hypothetical protein n=1 Tax=Actinosynnema sp. NPDC050436 TaxID=3155659 RepID=UPI0033DA9F17
MIEPAWQLLDHPDPAHHEIQETPHDDKTATGPTAGPVAPTRRRDAVNRTRCRPSPAEHLARLLTTWPGTLRLVAVLVVVAGLLVGVMLMTPVRLDVGPVQIAPVR